MSLSRVLTLGRLRLGLRYGRELGLDLIVAVALAGQAWWAARQAWST